MEHKLKAEQKLLPDKPGVYIFLNSLGDALYVGKAKNLKKRTAYYFKTEILPLRLSKMVFEATQLKFHVTENENEAFLLEAQLIKQKQPIYNIQYKHGRSFSYLIFSNHDYPRILIQKNWENGAIGPFLSYSNLKNIMQELLTIFLVRTCSDASFNRRKRPCLEYFAKKCSAPCMNLISKEQYQSKVEQMKALFSGKNKEIFKTLKSELRNHILNERFELAAKLRDNIMLLNKLKEKQGIFFDAVKRVDIVLFFENIFYLESFKDGAIINIEYRKYAQSVEYLEMLFNYYIEEPEFKILGLENISFSKYTNQLTSKEKKIISFAQARFESLLLEDSEQKSWQDILNLEKLETIESYDCSHYNSKFALCGMVKFNTDGEPLEKEYKVWRYNKNVFNDLEILEFGLKERAQDGILPDLILIDGGKTQLEVAKKALFPFKNILAYAKGEKRKGGTVYFYNGEAMVTNNTRLLMFFEKLRQAAHNWAKKNAMYRFSSKY